MAVRRKISNMTSLEAVLNLEARVGKQLADNVTVTNLATSVQFNAGELKERKQKIKDLEKENEQNCKENSELKERVRAQERYRMRWCLWI